MPSHRNQDYEKTRKGCVVVIASTPRQLQHFSPEKMALIKEYKKILIATEGLKKSITDAIEQVYSDIIFIPCGKVEGPAYYHSEIHLEEALLESIRGFSKDSVYVHSADEFNLDIVAKVTTRLGLVGYDSEKSILFRDKDKMKQYLAQYSSIPMPAHCLINNETEYEKLTSKLGLPLIVKPVDQAGAVGIYKIENKKDWDHFLKNTEKHTYAYEAEVFLSGILYHIDTVRVRGINQTEVVCEYLYPPGDHVRGKALASIALQESDKRYAVLIEFNNRVLDAFQVDGAFHLECFYETDKEPVFLEVAWRQSGMPVAHNFMQLHAGYSQSLYYLFAQLGMPVPKINWNLLKEVWLYFPNKPGIFKGLELPSDIKSHCDITLLSELNKMFKASEHCLDSSAHVKMTNANYLVLKKDFYRFRSDS